MRFVLILLALCSLATAQEPMTVSVRIESYAEYNSPPRIISNRAYYAKGSKVSEGDMGFVVIKGDVDAVIVDAVRSKLVGDEIVTESAEVTQVGRKQFAITGTGKYSVQVTGFIATKDAQGETFLAAQKLKAFLITLGEVKPEPPKPDDPPKPDYPPKPEPVKSFRVIFVKESGQLLSKDQMAISGAKTVRDYLTQRTTPEGGLAGWREYDPQQNIANEQATMKQLWAAAKSAITKVPSLVVEKNGKVEIIEYPKNVADALSILKGYGGQ